MGEGSKFKMNHQEVLVDRGMKEEKHYPRPAGKEWTANRQNLGKGMVQLTRYLRDKNLNEIERDPTKDHSWMVKIEMPFQ